MTTTVTTKNAPPPALPVRDAFRTADTSLFLDVRTPSEYEEAHIGGSVLHPLADLRPETVRNLASGKSQCVVVCRSGGRARQAASRLVAAGLAPVSVLEGGLAEWEAAGLPLIHGRRMISLERQVRITAGALVVFGAALGFFLNPAWIGLSAFVGAGLVFAGLTDTCGMAMLLARMPWNNRQPRLAAEK
jgi:rhodanese-related sulfurtransferase